jgi:hypothetical protein
MRKFAILLFFLWKGHQSSKPIEVFCAPWLFNQCRLTGLPCNSYLLLLSGHYAYENCVVVYIIIMSLLLIDLVADC